MTDGRLAVAPAAVLFDLDGTLLDTAPDMGAALNRLLARHGRAPLSAALIRPHVSSGTSGMLRIGFGIGPGDPDWPVLRDEYLALYAADLCRGTVPFAGIDAVLGALAGWRIPWGIVTNKPAWLTDPLLAALALPVAPDCVVSGDTAARPKPHPDPLLHAAGLLGHDPARCWYVGDHARDIIAGRAAGMATLAACYGYMGDEAPPEDWGADRLIDAPLALRDLIALALDRDGAAV